MKGGGVRARKGAASTGRGSRYAFPGSVRELSQISAIRQIRPALPVPGQHHGNLANPDSRVCTRRRWGRGRVSLALYPLSAFRAMSATAVRLVIMCSCV